MRREFGLLIILDKTNSTLTTTTIAKCYQDAVILQSNKMMSSMTLRYYSKIERPFIFVIPFSDLYGWTYTGHFHNCMMLVTYLLNFDRQSSAYYRLLTKTSLRLWMSVYHVCFCELCYIVWSIKSRGSIRKRKRKGKCFSQSLLDAVAV